jgi:uncharacterized protein
MWRNQEGKEGGKAGKQQRWTRWGARKQAEKETAAAAARAEPVPSRETPAIAGMQRRTFARAVALASRSAGASGRVLSGTIPFNSQIGKVDGYVEMFRPGAFAASIEADDPRVLGFLNIDKVLGRKSAGTARFWEDRDAFHFEVDMPETSYGNDLLISIGRGDVDEVDVIFRVMECDLRKADDGSTCRVITRAQLICTSVTSWGAFQTAQVTAKQEIAAARAEGYKAGLAQAKKSAAAPHQAKGTISPSVQ